MIVFPENKRGRKTAEDAERYRQEVESFCNAIKEINSRLEFKLSSRGWCYQLEDERIINKDQFDKAQILINDCRKAGLLPIDICADDDKRIAEGVDDPNNSDPKRYAEDIVSYVRKDLAGTYHPYYFSDYQDSYIELRAEKIDLIKIFAPICNKYHIPYSNTGGWSDLNSRADMMRRFAEWERKGKRCVLLYCGDHDPGGLQISDFIINNLNDLRDAVGWSPVNLIIDRFGLNYDFIIENDLTWIDNLKTGSEGEIAKELPDGRIVQGLTKQGKPHPDFNKDYVQDYLRKFRVRKVEANALVTRITEGRQLCEDTILKYIDPDGMDLYNKETQKARRRVQTEITKQFKS